MPIKSEELVEQAWRDAARALAEDAGRGDLLAGFAGNQQVRATVHANEAGILAGVLWFEACLRRCAAANYSCSWQFSEGEAFAAGAVLAGIEAPGDALLAAERPALNFLQMLCAVATQARALALAAAPVPVYDTRKTLPMLRVAQKNAAVIGGMRANRSNLGEAVIIKENHISAAGTISESLARARRRCSSRLIQVEVSSLAELDEALAAGAERIMLDNFSPALIRRAVVACAGRAELEASGGIHAGNIGAYTSTGVDRISSSAATKGAGAIDLSLKFE